MKVDGSVDWGVDRGVCDGVGIVIWYELDIHVWDEVGEGVEFEIGGKVVST